jgi:ADP-heptose:LPS heptosyltransferase
MKILLIRFSSIGDIVLCSPILRCLRRQLGAELHFLTKKTFASLLQYNPHINKVYALDQNLDSLIPQLQSEDYDFVVDLHHNLRSQRVKWALGKPSGTFDKLNLEKWLLVNLGINRLPNLHIVDRYFSAVSTLKVENDGKGLDFFIPPEEELDFLAQFGFDAAQSIAFVIGAAHATKRLPEEKITALCAGLTWPIVLLGGSDAAEMGDRVARVAGNHIFNQCGKLRIGQSASVVRQAGVVVTHDTGLMHIAAAFHKDIVSVWGNTVPEFGMYPYLPTLQGQNASMEVKGLSCRPCSKIGHQKCPKGHFKCMQNQDIEIITARISEVFGR